MTKEIYKQILHEARNHEARKPGLFEGIITVALYDNDIKLKDYDEIIDEMNVIIMKERDNRK